MLDEELKKKLHPQFDAYRFFYKDENGDEHDLVAEDVSTSVHPLSDEHGRWSPDENGFGLDRSGTIRCSSFLYGENGVACKDAVLALALVWKSSDSRRRSAFEICEIPDSNEVIHISYNKYFPKPRFKGRLDFQVCIIIKKAGNPTDGEELFANMAGTVLGVLDSFSVAFDGTGSSFPIMIVNDRGGLLWSIRCSFDDPLTEKLASTVSINLNSAHRDFKYINPTSKSYNPAFLREVLADAMANIVDCIRETPSWWDEIKNGNGEPESVAMAINYFMETLDLNLDDAKQCSIAFRDYFERKLLEL